jgi:exonuclease III
MEWSPISERIIIACFKTKIHNLTIIQRYAPAALTEKSKKEEFYQQLRETITKLNRGM